MHPLAERARRTIRRHDLVPRGGRLLAALSGGSDSVALVHLLAELHEAGELRLVGVAHLNHQLRGAEADADEQFCRSLAAALALPIWVDSIDVGALACRERTSTEDAARTARYAFFARAASAAAAERVAVGHTRDDQAETFLLRLMRGAGPRGLAAIFPRAGATIRPLLDVSRQELRDYLAERGITFVEDATNADCRIPRNRVRHVVLPLLREQVNPAVTDVLAREAAIARHDAEFLDAAAADAGVRIVAVTPEGYRLDREELAKAAPALQTRVVRNVLMALADRRFIGAVHIEALLDVATDEGSPLVDLPGIRAERIGAAVVLTKRGEVRPGSEVSQFRYPLSIPGEVDLPEAGCAISAELARADPSKEHHISIDLSRDVAVVAAGKLSETLSVRSRKPGDLFRPLGLGGHKKLQDFFVDRKILRSVRDRVPLVVDDSDQIIWVAGHAVADDFRVTDRTEPVVILKLTQLGGEG